MTRRHLPHSAFFALLSVLVGCSSSTTDSPAPVPDPAADAAVRPEDDGGAASDAGPAADSGTTDGDAPSAINPLQGIGAVTLALGGINAAGPLWHDGSIYVAQAYGDLTTTGVARMTPPSTSLERVHGTLHGSPFIPAGNAYDPVTNELLSIEMATTGSSGPNAIVRSPAAAAVQANVVHLRFETGVTFAEPRNLVVRSDGTVYISDAGVQAGASPQSRIFRMKPGPDDAQMPPTTDIFATVAPGRPTGLALSSDQHTLYVSFPEPAAPALPMIMRYPLAAADGALGVGTKVTDVGPADSAVAGLAVDSNDNLYAAVKDGVDVFTANGSTKWGHIATPFAVNGVAFGGADRKTLYLTSDSGSSKGIYTVAMKIAGSD